MALHDPVNFSRIVRGLINIQQHEGLSLYPYLHHVANKSTFCGQDGYLNVAVRRPSNSYKAEVVRSSQMPSTQVSVFTVSPDGDPILGEFFVK